MIKIPPNIYKLDRAIERACFRHDVIIRFAYQPTTDKYKVSVINKDFTFGVATIYCGNNLSSMSQSQIHIVIEGLAKLIAGGVAKDIWE